MAKRTIELGVKIDGVDDINKDLNKLEDSLQKMKAQLAGMSAGPEFDKLSSAIKQVESNLQSMGQSAGEAAQEQITLNQALGEAEDELGRLALSGDTTSKAYQDLVQEVGRLKKVQMETNAITDRAAAGFAGKLTVGVQRVAGAYQVGMAATQMFGVESEKAQKIMAQLQAVMAFTQGIEQLKQLTVGMKLFGNGGIAALSGIKKAIIATGIGALVVAVGSLVAYWDDIVGFIGDAVGASSDVLREQEKLVETAKQNVGVAEKQMEQFSLQENSLRLQGKSEKEILQLRLERINAVITEQETYVAAMEQKSKLEIEQSRRNQDIITQVIRGGMEMSALGLRALALPIDALIKTANEVSELLGFGELTTFSINKEIDKLLEKGSEYAATFFVDTDALEAENKKLIEEEKNKLAKLKSDRDGLKLQILQIEKAEKEGAIANAKERAEKLKELREQELEIIKGIYQRDQEALSQAEKAKLAAMEEGAEKQKALLEAAYGDERKALIEKATEAEVKALDERYASSKMSEEQYIKELEKIRAEGWNSLTDAEKALLTQKEKDKNIAIGKIDKDEKDKLLKRQEEFLSYKEGLITDADEKALLQAQKAYDNEKKELDEFLKDKVITQEQYDQLLIDAEQRRNDEINKINTAARNKEKMEYAKFFTDMAGIFDSIAGEGTELIASLGSTIMSGIGSFIELSTQQFESTTEKVNAYAQAIGGMINSVLGAVSAEQQARLEENLANVEQTYEHETQLLENQKEQGIITEEEFAQRKYQTDLKRFNQEEALRKKAFEQEKSMKIASTIVAGLQGAVAAFAGAMQLGPIAGPIVGGVLAGIVGVMTAVNVAQIASTKYQGGTPPAAPSISGGAEGAGSAIQGAMTSPTPSATTLFGAPMTGGNQGGQEQGMGQRQQPMRAYVLESDITTSQNTISTYEQRAEIG